MPLMRVLDGVPKDLGGGFSVRRVLPSVEQRSVGPFVFFDHFGPVRARPKDNHDVRPHPHIGLATVTYLFEGAMMHRDSLGTVQRIEPGAVNWMTAGRGIVHSERTPDDLRGVERSTHGLQLWVALPPELEETAPDFQHVPADAIPEVEEPGAIVRVLVGDHETRRRWYRSPVRAASPTLYLDVRIAPGGQVRLPLAEETAIYTLDEDVIVDGEPLAARTMGVLHPYLNPRVLAPRGARVVLIGGAALKGPRVMWWNFVSTRPERIRKAAEDWAAGRFDPIAGETEAIPLPATRLP